MNIEELKQKMLFQMNGEELMYLQRSLQIPELQQNIVAENATKEYVYGISGIARVFGCSIPTANRIKASGKIDGAITQIGRKIIIDSQLALELAGRKNGGRR
jgi:hypothetical protein